MMLSNSKSINYKLYNNLLIFYLISKEQIFQFFSFVKHKKMKNFLTLVLLLFVALSTNTKAWSADGYHGYGFLQESRDFVTHPDKSFDKFFPWASTSATVLMPCPAPLVFNLSSGQCSVQVDDFGFSFPDFATTPLTFNQNNNTVTINSTRFCATGLSRYRRTFVHGGPTDIRISTINLGVYEASNSPFVRFNFYTTSGILLGTYGTTITNSNRVVRTITVPAGTDIKIPALSTFVMEVVASAPGVSVFKMGMNNNGNFGGAIANVSAPIGCNPSYNQEIWTGSPGITPDAVVFNALGTPDAYRYQNVLNNFEEGDVFPLGVTPLTYVVTDANGNSTACPFTITVNEFATSNTTLACNDLVQVSLDEDCELVITPDMLLEGDHYGCFDKYTVQIIGVNGQNLQNKVTRANIGQRLKTQIISANGNSCWGEILVQDKLGPLLVCEDIYTNCESDLRPGSEITEQIPIAAIIPTGQGTIGTEPTRRKDIAITVGEFQEGTLITDLDVFIDITHPNVSHLAAEITSPDGVTVPLFFNIGCDGDNMVASFDDGGDLLSCESAVVPAIAGRFRPVQALSIFNGKELSGTWTVSIFDLVPGGSGTINSVHLVFGQEGNEVLFPTPNEVTFVHVSDNTYRVTGIDNCVAANLTYTDRIVEENCQSIYSKVIERCWVGSDINGNPAEPCCQRIYVYRNSLSTLVFPPNFDGLDGNPEPLSCFIYADSIPPVSVTGLPDGNFCDNVQIADPIDIRIEICPNSYKLLRTHKVIEWCSGNVIVHNQVIKVVDNEGPELECPDNVTVSTDDYSCTARYVAVYPTILAECSENLDYVLSYNSFNEVDSEFVTTGVNQLTGTISALNLGDNWIKWTVTDECGNMSSCTYKVTVVDDVRPNAVCDRLTVTSITGNGIAVVEAITFDDGSVDNCGVFRYEVRKMADSCGFGTTVFTPYVEFCCKEVGNTMMVELRVTDIHGNSNSCMVEVRVEDKLPPYITKCPADLTLDCQADFTNLDFTKRPEYVDNCEVINVTHKDVVKINQCGVGTVTRTWTVEDKQGFKNTCVQVITLVDRNPFRPSDITWPRNYETKKCFSVLDPASLPGGFDKPTFRDDNCSLVAAHHKDQVFKFVDGACEKVLRTWTVIDWCTYNDLDPVYGEGWYEHVQIIKLQNDVIPQFVGASGTTLDGCIDRTVPVYGNCEGDVDFTMTAIDDCPEDNTNLNWSYTLFREDGVTPIETKATNRFFKNLAVGRYVIKWTAEDKCGNRAFCTHKLNVVEAKKPTPYCITSLTTAVMNSNGTVGIWARDYDKGSFDNCTAPENLWFTFFGATPVDSLLNVQHYFKGNGIRATLAEYNAGTAQIWLPASKSSGLLFDCADIPNGKSQEVSLDMTVTDLAGNQDYCTVIIVLQDNAGVCPDVNSSSIAIQGFAGSNGLGIKNAEVTLESNKPEGNKTIYTDVNGQFSLNNLTAGNTYEVSVSDNTNLLNGVSTLDMVLIQRHILGIQTLSDSKLIIAADADNNGKVTASDLVSIRKAILGITEAFPNGQKSWRFITANQTFANANNPFPFIEKYQYANLNSNKVGQNFQAIKIGDVNASATINANNAVTENRASSPLILATEVKPINNQRIEVPVMADVFDHVYGYQFTMEFNPEQYTLESVESGALAVNESNFGMTRVQKGIITTSWNQEDAVSLQKGEKLFTLIFRANNHHTTDKVIQISSAITPAVAYGAQFEAKNINLISRSEKSLSFALLQNKPNPFQSATWISFVLPEAADATLTITDITGRVIKSINGSYSKGENSIKLESSELGTTGVLMYRIDSGNYSETKKMIILE